MSRKPPMHRRDLACASGLGLLLILGCRAETPVVKTPSSSPSIHVTCPLPQTCAGRAITLKDARLSPFNGQSLRGANGQAVAYQWDNGSALRFMHQEGGSPYKFSDERGEAVRPRVDMILSVREGGAFKDERLTGGTYKDRLDFTVPPDHKVGNGLIRFEGPTWENEYIGYRLYLDERNGTDIFGKTTAELVLKNKGYDGDDYHALKDWGADILKVGPSLGIGAVGLQTPSGAVRLRAEGTISAKLTHDGPIYAGLRVSSGAVQHKGRAVDIETDYAVQAGSRLTSVSARSSEPLQDWVTGIVKHPNTQLVQSPRDKSWSYVASYGAQSVFGGDLGMVIFFPSGVATYGGEDEHNYVVKFNGPSDIINYRMGAVWPQDGREVLSLDAFKNYLETERDYLSRQPNVTIKFNQ